MKDYLWSKHTTHLKVDEPLNHPRELLKHRVQMPRNGLNPHQALRLGRKLTWDSRFKH